MNQHDFRVFRIPPGSTPTLHKIPTFHSTIVANLDLLKRKDLPRRGRHTVQHLCTLLPNFVHICGAELK